VYAQVMGFPTALGLPRMVSQQAPMVLRQLGLIQSLARIVDVIDLGDVLVEKADVGDEVDRRLRKVLTAAHRQAVAFKGVYARDSLPITLGGDHTTSLGTALALKQLGLSFDVVWLDAHRTPLQLRHQIDYSAILRLDVI